MSPSSSTFSSEAARYLGVAVLTAVLLVSSIAGISLIGIDRGLVTWKEARLLRYQLDKIAAASRVDILLVGDSALGNAVDARVWSRETGREVLSVPLTGDYGYGGSLNMLRRVLRHHRPELVVVFQSPEIMRRHVAYDGLMYTAETLGDIRGIPPWRLLGPLATWDIPLNMLANVFTPRGPDPDLITDDYIRQQMDAAKARAKVVRDARFLKPAMVHPERAVFLREIGALCARERIVCLYAHGPYVEPECSSIEPYLEKVNALIRASGLIVVPETPVCMPLDDAGDAPDHVAPALKKRYSEIYRSLIDATINAPAVAQARDASKPGPGARLQSPQPAGRFRRHGIDRHLRVHAGPGRGVRGDRRLLALGAPDDGPR